MSDALAYLYATGRVAESEAAVPVLVVQHELDLVISHLGQGIGHEEAGAGGECTASATGRRTSALPVGQINTG